jgi:hypothetical protein
VSSPPLGTSLVLGVRAAAQESWLIPVGALVSFVRTVATAPALAVGAALALEAAAHASALRPFSPTAPLEGAAAVVASPRFLALVGGLLLAGTLLSAALRVLFFAGALPTLGARLAGIDPTRRFAPGVALGLPRQLGTWLLSGLVELTALTYLLAVLAAVARVGGLSNPPFPPVLLAGFGAAALTVAMVGLLLARVLGDAAAARTAILGEGPARAWAGAVRRFLGRPGGFTLAGLLLLATGTAVTAALQPATQIVGGLSGRVDDLLLLGPELMLALVATLGAAAMEVAWLAAVSVLACAEAPAPASRVSA